jgi:monoamine oxidase
MTLGGDSSQLSALYVLRQYAMGHGSTQRFKIQGGMDRLPRAMAASLGSAIRFNAPVVRVSRRGGAFRVDYRTDDGLDSVTASHVIFAVPFTTLRQIEIDPPLSREKSRMIDGLAYYPGVRFLLQSRTRFWQGAGQSGAARTDKATEVWHSTHDTLGRQKGILGASTGGIVGHRLAGMSQDDALREGVRLVADAFPRVDSEFERGVVVRWSEEPWSRGAFAAFGPGQMTAMMPAIARPEDGIHFAGEHTSAWTGWMEGALESGERAAREVLGLATEARGVREATVTGRK